MVSAIIKFVALIRRLEKETTLNEKEGKRDLANKFEKSEEKEEMKESTQIEVWK